jgi:multidrug efflux pump
MAIHNEALAEQQTPHPEPIYCCATGVEMPVLRDPAGARDHIRVHSLCRDQLAAHFARRTRDPMITVEMMVARLEVGDGLTRAATYAYTSTAFPMLSGILVTVAGCVPIGLSASSAGEYCFTLFAVIASAPLISWVVAVLFTPLLGVAMLPKTMKRHSEKPRRFRAAFTRLLRTAMRWRFVTIALTATVFAVSLIGLGFVQQQFFPASDRPELLVDLTLPQNSSIAGTDAQVARFDRALADDKDVEGWSSYIGQGAIRFYLPLDQQLANPFFAKLVIVTRDSTHAVAWRRDC